MDFRNALFLLAVYTTIFTAYAQHIHVQNARIVIPPNPVNISENAEIIVNCTIIGHHINWKVNNEPISDFPHPGFYASKISMPINGTPNMCFGQLRITGSRENNGTMITCVASQLISNNFTVAESKPVLILVQGLLEAVSDLKIKTTDTRAILTWDAPNTLAQVPIQYDIRLDTCSSRFISGFQNTTLHHSYELPHHNVYHMVTVNPVNKAGIGAERVTSVILPSFMVQVISMPVSTNSFGSAEIMPTKTSFLQSASTSPTSTTEMPINYVPLLVVGIILLIFSLIFAIGIVTLYFINRRLKQRLDILESEKMTVQKRKLIIDTYSSMSSESIV